MLRRLALLAMIAAVALGAGVVRPSSFYIVSIFFSDSGPRFYYRLIEVTPDGSGSLVRYSWIGWVNFICPRTVVQSVERHVDQSPARLARRNNPCGIEPRDLNAALSQYAQAGNALESISFGIVAQCGAESISLGLPIQEGVNFKRFRRAKPQMARLWYLPSRIESLFGDSDVFHNGPEGGDLALQRAGEKIVPELVSGRYDPGLAEAAKADQGAWKSPSFRSLLADYRGIVSAQEARTNNVQLTHAYRFAFFTSPIYPSEAIEARVEGQVELQLNLAPTGEVLKATAISGDPLLRPGAIKAAGKWRFDPGSIHSDALRLTVDFPLRCQ